MLTELDWTHKFEHKTAEGFSLDLVVPDSKQAIKVDGPSHFLPRVVTSD